MFNHSHPATRQQTLIRSLGRIALFGFCLFISLIILAGCAGEGARVQMVQEGDEDRPLVSAKPDSIASMSPAAPAPLNRSAMEDPYRLAYGDVVEIKFFYNSELNETVAVRPDGRISIAPLGDVSVKGLTCEETAALIEEKISTIIRNPSVSVIVRELRPARVYVLGEVGRPGGVDFREEMSLLQALSESGGLLKTAKRSSIMIVRMSDGGEPYAIKADITRVTKSESYRSNVPLLPEDIVYVPDTVIAKIDTFVEQFFKDILPVFDVYLAGYDVLHPDSRYRTSRR
jgi:protein involved in polysaccharide export with SLBB domain